MLLIKGDEVTLRIENLHQTYKGQIFKDIHRGYFIGAVKKCTNEKLIPKYNDEFLVASGFNTKSKQKELYENMLHYWEPGSSNSGWWPWCKTREDMMKILKHLDKDNKNFISLQFVV